MRFINPFGTSSNDIDQELVEQEHQQEVARQNVDSRGVDETAWYERQKEMAELKRWQQDLAPKFKSAFEELCGKRFQNGKLVEIPHVRPKVNVNGAYHLINFVKILDQNVMRSNYTDSQICQNLRYGVGNPIIREIKDNREAYGISKNFGVMSSLVHYLFNLVEPTYRHAFKDGERRHESSMMKYIETKNAAPQKKKKGLFA